MELPVIEFTNIEIDEEFHRHFNQNVDLSTEQKYLRDIILSFNTGNITSSMKTRSPGKLGYARWLTTENRILRVYISTPDPSSKLISLVKYVIHVYARSWFDIKCQSSFIHGSRQDDNIYTKLT